MVLQSVDRTAKRKADENTPAAKKSRITTDGSHASVAVLVDTIIANPKSFVVPSNEQAVRSTLVDLAHYARALEQQKTAPSAPSSSPTVAAGAARTVKTKEQLEQEAERIRNAAQNGIIKQMGWKPTCKVGRAKWSYDGFCPDPAVFGVLLGLGGPPTFKVKKFKADAFEKLIGELNHSVRYATLYITSAEVTVRWTDTGEFKFSGSYGKLQSKN